MNVANEQGLWPIGHGLFCGLVRSWDGPMMGRSGGLMVVRFGGPIGLIFMQEGYLTVRGGYTETILSNTLK
jgi:hypothetical protein